MSCIASWSPTRSRKRSVSRRNWGWPITRPVPFMSITVCDQGKATDGTEEQASCSSAGWAVLAI